MYQQMVCHFCLDHSHYREQASTIEFCDQYCQIGYHIVRIAGHNPLELKDTIFSTLLRVPPSQLFRLYNVSRKFRKILQENNSFKVAYLQQWEISDEFYMRCKYFYQEWMPFINGYRGFLDRMGSRDEIFTAAVLQYRLDIVILMLSGLTIGNDAVRWCITTVIHREHYEDAAYLVELFKYGKPSNQDLQDAVVGQLDPIIIELILGTGAITDVSDAIRWAGIHDNAPVMRLLLKYQQTLTVREGVLKRQKK